MSAYHLGKTAPLRDIMPKEVTSAEKVALLKTQKPSKEVPNFFNYSTNPNYNLKALPEDGDPLLNRHLTKVLGEESEPIVVIEGIDQNTTGIFPPDPNGDVSSDYYIQTINASFFQVFEKDGTQVSAPIAHNTLWNEVGLSAIGDPIILFDESADRWLISDLGNLDQLLYGVSETNDPLGSWDIYSFNSPAWIDYPKLGIWPNAYIFTANEAGSGDGNYPVYCMNRDSMLAGAATVPIQYLEIEGVQGGFPTATPFDWNSPLPPPDDNIYSVRINDDVWGISAQDELEVWTINIDWEDENNSTLALTRIPTAPYDAMACDGGGIAGTACVPQPGVGRTLDAIMSIVMNNVVYWNYGTHESAVLNFTVDLGNDVLGVRWMELRKLPGEDWTLYQEGTVGSDDGLHRFMGSIAINGKGDIGLAYSVAGDDQFASLRYLGRREADVLGEMSFDEYQFADGLSSIIASNRFGDYSKMTTDPIDDSFWFVGEYAIDDGFYGSKIVNFNFQRDTFDVSPRELVVPLNADDLGDSEIVRLRIVNNGLMPADSISVGYIFEDGAEIIEAIALDTLFPDSSYVHEFVPTVDMSEVKEYDFKLFTIFNKDLNQRNDTLDVTREKLPQWDASVRDITGLDFTICGTSKTVSVTLYNIGTLDLTNALIIYSTNTTGPDTINWTGLIESGASEMVNLDLQNLTDGPNNLMAYASLPNGEVDQRPENDAVDQGFNVETGGQGITIEILTDLYPQETTWALFDNSGIPISFGGPYTSAVTIETTSLCVSDSTCYTFEIYDSYGDGITFGGVAGDYTIRDADGNILASIINVNFGDVEVNNFCINFECNLEATLDINDAATSNSNDGLIIVNVESGVAPFTYSINGLGSLQNSPIFPDLGVGNYTVLVVDANGCELELEASVSSLVANNEINDAFSISVSPNPSEDGIYDIEVNGLSYYNSNLEIIVVDAQGKRIGNEVIPRFNDLFKGRISLRNQPAGMYYFQLKHRDLNSNQILSVIRL